ncbi:hypothetical protein KA111_01640 [Candidatus Woesebacteria bacterium]|nr:hypothetical protein [Candidatus Woesebacteria bacterium]
MNDNSAQNQNQSSASYVDDYQPPMIADDSAMKSDDFSTNNSPADSSAPVVSNDLKADDSFSDPAVADQKSDDMSGDDKSAGNMPGDDMSGDDMSAGNMSGDDNSVDNMQTDDSEDAVSEKLDDQNIFFMLGAENGGEEVKENFLNELQDVVWNDFLENDVNMLITSEEKVKFDEIMAKRSALDPSQINGQEGENIQNALIAYLETLIPDLEEIMLEKALDLKSDLFVERIAGLREYNSGNPAILEQINRAEQLMNENKWHSASEILNKVETN